MTGFACKEIFREYGWLGEENSADGTPIEKSYVFFPVYFDRLTIGQCVAAIGRDR